VEQGEAELPKRIPELALVWRGLSELVQQARTTPMPSASNEVLLEQVDNDPAGPLAPALLLWAGDNLVMEKRFDEAIEVYERLVREHPERKFSETSWASMALEAIADCHEHRQRPEDAIVALRRIPESFPDGRSPSYVHYRIGRIAEKNGRIEEASAGYEKAKDSEDTPSETQISVRDLAARSGDRLRSGRGWMRGDPELVAMEVASRLEGGSQKGLIDLASPTHFGLSAVAGEGTFLDRDLLMEVVSGDLGRSKVRTDPHALIGSGDKRYLVTEGWQGRLLTGRVLFIIARSTWGWEWTGVALTEFPEEWSELLGTWTKESNQPISLSLRSPWPAGNNFIAGGILRFAAKQAGCLALPTVFMKLACTASLSLSPCGFGHGGLYYGGVAGVANFTHGGDDFFAIDFARYQKGVPFWNRSSGTRVLSVQEGLVGGVRVDAKSGDTEFDNRVLVKHMTEPEWILLVILELLSGESLRPRATPPFTSMYLHLAGPFSIPVSSGMFVRQGAVLGTMDDTGLSAMDHLHFSIHDRRIPGTRAEGLLTPAGRSVRPTPMDGQPLMEANDGRCVSSSNIPFP
jgi:hypothetical protein